MNETHTKLYRVMRRLIGLALGFYFRRIERFHEERVPQNGPVLFASNHPGSLTDSFVIGGAVKRKVNFVATVQLFRIAPLKWLLTHCGVIPINRVKDDPKAMRSVADTFEACFRVLERGEAIGIFPEGVTYDDSQLKEIKSGAARMALELEHRHNGKLGLQIVPVGLTYSAKERYRSDALVNFGEPIRIAEFLEGYTERWKECITRLTAEIERRIQLLILHIPQLEHARVVEGIKRLYFERLLLGSHIVHEPISHGAQELLLAQRISETVEQVYRTEPQRAAEFVARLNFYERGLSRLKISDKTLALFSRKRTLFSQSLGWAIIAVLGGPIALYGWVHRLVPVALVRYAKTLGHPEKRKAQASVAAIAGGIVGFGICFSVFVLVFHHFFGWPPSLWYALSLPITSLLAYYYLREMRKLLASLWTLWVLIRAPAAARRLLAMRKSLIAEIESVRSEFREPREKTTV